MTNIFNNVLLSVNADLKEIKITFTLNNSLSKYFTSVTLNMANILRIAKTV